MIECTEYFAYVSPKLIDGRSYLYGQWYYGEPINLKTDRIVPIYKSSYITNNKYNDFILFLCPKGFGFLSEDQGLYFIKLYFNKLPVVLRQQFNPVWVDEKYLVGGSGVGGRKICL